MSKKMFVCGCVTVILFYSCLKTIPNGAYAIGKITQYNPDRTGSVIHFYYYIGQDTLYASYPNGHHGWHVPANGHLKEGQEFIVQYNPLKTSEARMIFCYPIKDSSDYNQYVAGFALTPPSCY